MSTHTPGPWKWHQSHDGTSLRTPDRGQLIVMDVSESGELRFARRGPADRGGWLQEARVMVIGPRPLKTGFHDIDNPDARLIAAAPDLLAACEACAAWHWAEKHHSTTTFRERMNLCHYSEWLTLVALAKANGGKVPSDYVGLLYIGFTGGVRPTTADEQAVVDRIIGEYRAAIAKASGEVGQ